MSVMGKIPCSMKELRLDITLLCGQSFRWKELKPGHWIGALAGKVWLLSQNDDHILYTVYESDTKKHTDSKNTCDRDSEIKTDVTGTCTVNDFQPRPCDTLVKKERCGDTNNDLEHLKPEPHEPSHYLDASSHSEPYHSILSNYFQLHINLSDLYTRWSHVDKNFRDVAGQFSGVRILRQDPVENLFSFICSSNNNIARISGMVERMCDSYGEAITEVNGKMYHSFPTVSALAADNVEERLRRLGFGYRARYISETARYIMDKEDGNWLFSLRQMSYVEAKAELMKLCGVGAKVADCVCLMSLDKTGAIPVDTHVWQIASRDYMPHLASKKSVTDKIYKEIGDYFRSLWGDYAGWAHSVLFSADLKKFKDMKDVSAKSPEKVATGPAKKRKDKTMSAKSKCQPKKVKCR